MNLATKRSGLYLGVSDGPVDPAVALVSGGRVVAYADEERFSRQKHAIGAYPSRALRYCLESVGAGIGEIDGVGVAWDLAAYTNGQMNDFFSSLRNTYSVDAATVRWQQMCLSRFNVDAMTKKHNDAWRREFGDTAFPEILGFPHHFTHAMQAAVESGFADAVVLVADGSGDRNCTTIWHHTLGGLRLLREIDMPNSLGWFYAGITEYLGFEAYDGEYKVMGLAAHGSINSELSAALEKVVHRSGDGIEYRINPAYIHYGDHSYSGRFTDALVTLLGRPPRQHSEPLAQWHCDLALACQSALEGAVVRLASWALEQTGSSALALSGGVANNVKLTLALSNLTENIYASPFCGDNGGAMGAAMAVAQSRGERLEGPLRTASLGPSFSSSQIEQVFRACKLTYRRPHNLSADVASRIASGALVGWFQGRMEAGSRALGNRSILADPRNESVRDAVNTVVKQRELWRPFAPAILEERVGDYIESGPVGPYMTAAGRASALFKSLAPAVVHRDGTTRAQVVSVAQAPGLHSLIAAFERQTGVGALLNTSFNIKGEPIVCTVEDAIRTYYSTALDILVAGPFLVEKERP